MSDVEALAIVRDIERAAGIAEGEPHDLDAERAVLGAVLIGGGSVIVQLDFLRPCMFYRESHGLIWQAMLAIHRDRRGVDWLVVVDFLRRTGQLDHVGGRAVIDELCGAVPEVGNFAEYAGIVKRLWKLRKRRRALHLALDANSAQDEKAYREAWEAARP